MAEEFPHYIEFRNVYKTFDRPGFSRVNFHVDAGRDAGDHRPAAASASP